MTIINSINISIIGSKFSGKKSIIRRITENKFKDKPSKLDKDKCSFVINGNQYNLNFTIDVMDNIDAFIIVIDVTSKENFRLLPTKIDEIIKLGINFIILVGTKIDLIGEIMIDRDQIINFCKNYKIQIEYIETSAKIKKNIDKICIRAIELVEFHQNNKSKNLIDVNKNKKTYSTFNIECEDESKPLLISKHNWLKKFIPCIF